MKLALALALAYSRAHAFQEGLYPPSNPLFHVPSSDGVQTIFTALVLFAALIAVCFVLGAIRMIWRMATRRRYRPPFITEEE